MSGRWDVGASRRSNCCSSVTSTGKTDWLFLRQGDRFYGVYSSSEAPTIKRAEFPRRYVDFETEQTYGGWKFIYLAPGLRSTPTNAVPATPGRPVRTIDPQN